jgi:Golgi phosphoprotein 3 (GPP34)
MHDRNAPRRHRQPAAGPGRSRGPVNAGLAGTGLVADDVYLMAHHDLTGKPLLQPRPLGLGLAGGLLAELMLGGSIGLRYQGAVLVGRTWPGDDLTRRVRDQIAAEPGPRPLTEWLAYLARTAAPDVAARLERAGYLTRIRGRVPWRAGRLIPADPDWAFGPLLRVRSALDCSRPFDPGEAALAGLAVACGLGYRLDQYTAPAGRSLQEATGYLGPDLRELIAQTQAAVDSALLTHRT